MNSRFIAPINGKFLVNANYALWLAIGHWPLAVALQDIISLLRAAPFGNLFLEINLKL